MLISELIEQRDLEVTIVSAERECARSLSGASANEHEDPTPWIREGELVMTDGLELGRSRRMQTAYVDRLVAAGAAALALGIGEGLPFQKPPAGLVAACERTGVPLMVVPRTTPFSRLSAAVYGSLAEQRLGDAARMVEIQRELTRAAARPESSPAVIGVMCQLTGLSAAICDMQGAIIASAPDDLSHLPSDVLRSIASIRQRGLRASAALSLEGGHTRVQPIGAEAVHGYFVYWTTEGNIDKFAGAVATFALSLLSIDLERRSVVQSLRRKPREEALTRLLAGMPGAAASRLLSSVGMAAERVKVAVIDAPGEAASVVDVLADTLPEALVKADRARVLFVVAADAPQLLERLEQAAAGGAVGLGGPVAPHACPASLRQAERARSHSARHGGRPVDAMALGSSRLLLEAASTEMLAAYADAVLRPVETAAGGEILLASLRAWIEAGGAWEPAARSAGVHRHTMRNRIRRTEELTGRTLDRANDRGEIWLAFHARDLALSG